MFGEIIIAAIVLLNYGYVESAPNPLTIIGGSTTDNVRYKFLVSVHLRRNHCGGSIISPNLVITAAHCVHEAHVIPVRIVWILVRVGSWRQMPDQASVETNASDLFEHPDYDDETLVNDITLLRLQNTLVYGNRIGAIPLPIEAGMFQLDTIIEAIGFGESTTGEGANILIEANLEIKADHTCGDKYGIILDSQICAANENIRFCERDAGSPVLFEEQLIGIVSFTEEYDEQRGYTVLVRVPDYRQFILGIMNRNR